MSQYVSKNQFTPSPHFKKLARDIHEIRVDAFSTSAEKAAAISHCIDSFTRDPKTTNAELRKVQELMDGLRESFQQKSEQEALAKLPRSGN